MNRFTRLHRNAAGRKTHGVVHPHNHAAADGLRDQSGLFVGAGCAVVVTAVAVRMRRGLRIRFQPLPCAVAANAGQKSSHHRVNPRAALPTKITANRQRHY